MEVVTCSKTLNQQEGLQRLAHQLQDFLLALPQAIPFQVQCVVKRGHLMVLSQHPPDEKPDLHSVFEALEQAIQVLLPGFAEEIFSPTTNLQNSQGKLYLRALGQKHPYAYHCFKLGTVKRDGTETLFQEPVEETGEEPKQLEKSLDREGKDFDLEQLLVLEPEPEPEEDLLAQAEPALEEEEPEVEETAERSPWLLWVATGVGVSVVSFMAGIVIVSRPCIIGRCEPFQAAEAVSQEANKLIQQAKSEQDLRQAQQKLNEASQILSKIPLWSTRHREAQTLLRHDQLQLSQLDRVLAAERVANEATQKGQMMPKPLVDLQGIQVLWKSAIAQLESIPQGTPLHPFAQQRLATYRDNLSIINQYMATERQAQKKLAAAKSTANVAQARQGVAQSIENWQQVQVTWQVAVNALKQIPNTTTSFTEAQELLGDYGVQLAIARDRATREQRAQKAYQQAINLAQKAEGFQQRNQWTLAVTYWRSALRQIEQVPENTASYDPAQRLVSPYSNALYQAELQLQAAVAQQKLRTDLNLLCSGSPKTCTYFILSNVIRVQFTAGYEKALKQAFAAGQSGQHSILGGAVNHLESLQSALQGICNNAGMPIEVYNSSGTEMVGSFNPN
ncbi:hypothetical protein [Leptothermofonsia sp. ETS-13]|uniref:hypothetical protein n=1 Tax=Leptothermofonsia sp. ETS-13 TaxID=3035696 RepID=UPI003B9E3146